MDVRLVPVEERLVHVEEVLRGLEQRLIRLEALAREGPQPGAEEVASGSGDAFAGAAAAGVRQGRDVAGVLSLAGRTLLVLGGAYVLRALTDSGALPQAAGVVLGLAYAAAWIGVAHATAPRNAQSATFHAGVAVAIGFPLVWEATTRFGLLSPAMGVVTLAVLSLGALAVAWHRWLHLVAWMATAGALVGAFALMASTGAYVPVALLTIGLGIAALWLGYDRDWFGLRWLVAVPANALVVAVTSRALAGREDPATALGVQMLLVSAYLGVTAARTLVRGRNVILFEVAQAVVGLVVGLGGAIAVVRASGSGMLPLGLANLALGAATYAVAFAFVDRRQGRGLNFYCYTTLALALTLVGGTLLLDAATASALWAGLAVVLAALGRRLSRAALGLHGAVYALAAAWTSGLIAGSVAALTGSSASPWPALTVAAWVALVATGVCSAVLPTPDVEGSPQLDRIPRGVVAALLVVSAAGMLVALLVPRLAGTPGVDAAPGVVATIRTVVLAIVVMTVAWAGRHTRLSELGWWLYPLLVLTAVKLLFEDFPRSQPATLFVALAAFGIALIVAPRLAGRATTAPRG